MQEGGNAVPVVVFGRASPSGRLPITWYFQNYTTQIAASDMRMGSWPGRTYKYTQVPVLFPFGYGLSYATLLYRDFSVESHPEDGQIAFDAKVTVENEGGFSLPVDESVLLYASYRGSDTASLGTVPIRTLVAYKRVTRLRPSTSTVVRFTLGPDAFSLVAEDGTRAVQAGQWLLACGREEVTIQVPPV